MLAGLLFIGGLFYCAAKSVSDKQSGTGNYYKFPNGVEYYMDKRGCWRLSNGDPISRRGENWINCKNYKVVFEEGKWRRKEENKKMLAMAKENDCPVYVKTFEPEECPFNEEKSYLIDVKTGRRIADVTNYGGFTGCVKVFYRKDSIKECDKISESYDKMYNPKEELTVSITKEEFDKIVKYVDNYYMNCKLMPDRTCAIFDFTRVCGQCII